MSAERTFKNIWLIGFSGSGKSTVGPKLAKLLKMRFVDTDTQVERVAGYSISSIFEKFGEKRFRQLESRVVQKTAASPGAAVIATGGGTFQSPINRAIMRASGSTIYLRASVKVVYRRLSSQTDRPLLQVGPVQGETLRATRLRLITTLLSKRGRHYRTADIVVSTSTGTPSQIARKIMQKVRGIDG